MDEVTVRCLVQDRFRGLRQELDQQRIYSEFAVRMIEAIVRYFATSCVAMCEGACDLMLAVDFAHSPLATGRPD